MICSDEVVEVRLEVQSQLDKGPLPLCFEACLRDAGSIRRHIHIVPVTERKPPSKAKANVVCP